MPPRSHLVAISPFRPLFCGLSVSRKESSPVFQSEHPRPHSFENLRPQTLDPTTYKPQICDVCPQKVAPVSSVDADPDAAPGSPGTPPTWRLAAGRNPASFSFSDTAEDPTSAPRDAVGARRELQKLDLEHGRFPETALPGGPSILLPVGGAGGDGILVPGLPKTSVVLNTSSGTPVLPVSVWNIRAGAFIGGDPWNGW